MKSKLTLLIVLLVACSNVFGQQAPARSDTLALLLQHSNTANKKLFMVFGWEGCSWCRIFDKYHEDSTVHAILSNYFMIAKVDMMKSKAGVDLYKTYGKEGTPSWTIFDATGQVVIDSDDNGKGNVGYPAQENELAHYVRALKKAVPVISEQECTVLVDKLKEYRNKKKQNAL